MDYRSVKWSWVVFGVVACGPQVGLDDGDGGTDSESMTTGPSGPSSMDASDVTGVTTSPTDPTGDGPDMPTPVPGSNAVDVILVVDNSGSMGSAQARVAEGMAVLVEVLDSAGADWRLAVTTTDNGNPWCDGTSPEGGKFVATSCRSRTQDFLFNGAIQVDATQEACLDVCPEEWSDIPLTSPWIESSAGITNLPAGLDTVTALQCIVPQGINGCGFEQPLESLYKAIKRTTTDGEESYGFLRPEATLAVMIVSDEVDCSSNPDHETIFLPDGNRVFWSDPSFSSPTSAVCWNAGVACTGAGPTYDECHSVNLDTDGNELPEGEAESDAAIRPLLRYTQYLQTIEDEKHSVNPAAEVIVAVVGGFGSDGSVVYSSGSDPQDLVDFGIGPGCVSESMVARPPVRMRELSQIFASSSPNRFSICDVDYTSHFETFGKSIAEHLP